MTDNKVRFIALKSDEFACKTLNTLKDAGFSTWELAPGQEALESDVPMFTLNVVGSNNGNWPYNSRNTKVFTDKEAVKNAPDWAPDADTVIGLQKHPHGNIADAIVNAAREVCRMKGLKITTVISQPKRQDDREKPKPYKPGSYAYLPF